MSWLCLSVLRLQSTSDSWHSQCLLPLGLWPFICAYAPTLTSEETVKYRLYQALHSLFRWTCSDKLSKSARDFFYDGQNTWVNYWTAWIQVSHSSRTNTSVSTHSLSWWYSFISWRDWRSKGTEGTKLSVLTIFLLRSLRMVKLTTRHIHHFP